MMTVGSFACWPKNVVSGPGAIGSLGAMVKDMGKTNVMVFTDSGMKEFPVIKNVLATLHDSGLTANLFSEIGPNPTEEMVHNAVAFMHEVKPEVLICIGGGSPIDAAKAANVVYTHGGGVGDYNVAMGGISKITPILLPLIAVPTTAGTGTEVTFVGVITDTKNETKYGVVSPLLIPDIAVLDPEITVTMPPTLTAFTGIDALTHCIESYTATGGFAPAEALALQAIAMISRSLRVAVKDGHNLTAREEMLLASMMAGTAFSLNGLGACHAMAHQLSAVFGMPHGLANAILLPKVMEFNILACPQKFAAIAQAMGANVHTMSEEDAAYASLTLVEQLCADVGVPLYLDDAGATKDKIPALVEKALLDNPLTTNPREATASDLIALFEKSFR
ncbi:MAG: iron-containing alcohol dehydrogenase [Firmicutes bacterium]|nr:iron-containing alcohol dehydrogenase [Bacillota bacterium]